MKANRVPMFVRSTISSMVVNIEQTPTARPVTIVVTCGVRNLGCTRAKLCGSSPSRAIEKKIRGWPSWNTRSTAVCATTDPNATIPTNSEPQRRMSAYCSAIVSGSACSVASFFTSAWYGMIPVKTAATTM